MNYREVVQWAINLPPDNPYHITVAPPPDKPISVQAIKSQITRATKVAHLVPFSARPTSKSKISPGAEPSGVIRGGAETPSRRTRYTKRPTKPMRYVIHPKDL